MGAALALTDGERYFAAMKQLPTSPDLSSLNMGLNIGPVALAHRTALAPMESITDLAFRRMIRSFGGCGLTVTEFISSAQLDKRNPKAWAKSALDPDEHPVSIQIYGRDPQQMANAAAFCEQLGADIVDLNLGCPSKSVTSGCAGSALMRDPTLSGEIFSAVSAALSIPFTVKMRLGWCERTLNAIDIARRAEGAGAAMVAVHGRTRMQMYKGVADWDAVHPIKAALSVPVLVNGDILTVEDALLALERSGADGVMVGRGTMRDPWLLRRISDVLAGREPTTPSFADRRDVLLRYFERMHRETPADRRALGRMKKITGYFTRGLPYGAELRQAIYHSHEIPAVYDAVQRYFGRLESEALSESFSRVHLDDGAYENGDDRMLSR